MSQKQSQVKKEKITIELNKKIVVLTIEPFDSDVDMDEYTRIHYHNIIGEILTCSVALNRIGNLLAEMDELLATKKLDFDIFMAQMKEEQRKKLTFNVPTGKQGETKTNKPTVDEVEIAVLRLPQYKVKKTDMISIQKNRDIINSLYWSMKSKDEKLNRISDKLRPEEFEKEIVNEKINGIYIKSVNKVIP